MMWVAIDLVDAMRSEGHESVVSDHIWLDLLSNVHPQRRPVLGPVSLYLRRAGYIDDQRRVLRKRLLFAQILKSLPILDSLSHQD